MFSKELKSRAEAFSKLHKEKGMFVLPNVWNAGSARIFESRGFKAVATTSAGIAYALGYPDGEQVGIDDLRLVVSQITKRVKVPVSVDFERGYGDTPEEVKANAIKMLEAGAVGFNIEDGIPEEKRLDNLDDLLVKIKALVELKKEIGIPFVINARTCVYWLALGNEDERIETAIARGNAFAEAGADCVFVPGAMDEKNVAELAKEIKAPLNIIANPVFHDFKKLEELGVRRLSIGSGAVRATLAYIDSIGEDLAKGDIGKMLSHDFSYTKANEFFA
ncbi:2-methylisocitrate lyase [Fulvitalea axinellae]|uniref:2-methylisocitrate lyase n=1 Tax=Fulvitalea axinellae TaxID=1182444 RepID=A0AAU9CCI2_9BACT|nr:2-methylisocitrate lyase [Fulvitalea axinellae]